MKLLETWVGTPLAAALGWTLLHSLWEGAVVAAILAVVLLATGSSRVRYAAACLAMLLLLGGVGLTFVRVMPLDARGLSTISLSSAAPGNLHTDIGLPSASRFATLVPWLAPFWIAGVWIFYLGHAASWISVRQLRRRGVCHATESWQEDLARLSAKLRISRPVVLLESCLADAPMVLGHFRPFILMPVGLLSGLPTGQIEAILLHELAHIRRCDYLFNVLQRSIDGVLFYHPAAWWISRVIRDERENCCDDVVVAISGDTHEYATALITLEQNRCSARQPAVAATGGSLVKRIRRLLYPEGPNGAWAPALSAVILIATAGVTLAAWQPDPPQQNPDVSPYAAWLNRDVVYIVSKQERATFEKLTTNDERDKFIEQFWDRRNPTPGSSPNAFKDEHYRRLAYANQRFKPTIDKAGWQTDRGRIYIMYGPADEVESHPSGGASAAYPEIQESYPYEVWKYRRIEGMGNDVIAEFIDPMRNGDYHLTLDPHR